MVEGESKMHDHENCKSHIKEQHCSRFGCSHESRYIAVSGKRSSCYAQIMLILCFLTAAALLAAVTKALSSNTAISAAPTGTSIIEGYNGPHRPQVHFSPPKGFMNDPNGMHRGADGVWHLYYQYNPTGTVSGNQHWGHATSTDLYHWENQPIALFPPNPYTYVFSGSAVVDTNNTSGFFPNQTDGVIAIYTLSGEYQDQNIAYSVDGGYTFTPYEHNPVIPSTSKDFRDPQVTWHTDTEQWVMVVAYAQDFAIGIFTSPNLREWTHASNFTNHGILGIQYECPNLVQMPMYASAKDTKPAELLYLLTISISPGSPLGGSVTQYFPGHFNGTHFTPVDGATRLTDFAKDNYAGQFFSGIPGTEPQISIEWASNWQYTNVVPTGQTEGWRSMMTLPRTTYLQNITRLGYELIQKPYQNLSPVLIDPPLATNRSLNNGNLLLSLPPTNPALYVTLNATSIPHGTAGTINIAFLSSVNPASSLTIGQLPLGGDLFVNRGSASPRSSISQNPFFTDKFSTSNPIDPNTGAFSLDLVWDRSILEIYCNGGERVGTVSVFPSEIGGFDMLAISTDALEGGVNVAVAVHELKGTWGNGRSGRNSTSQMVKRDRFGHLRS